jgi:hypothetical protein
VVMIRWTDLIGLAGFGMVLVATLLLFPDNADFMNWQHWLGGIALWLIGFASVVGWVLSRWSVRKSNDGPPPLLVWSLRQARHKETQSESKKAS